MNMNKSKEDILNVTTKMEEIKNVDFLKDGRRSLLAADLRGADLRGADLRGANEVGLSEQTKAEFRYIFRGESPDLSEEKKAELRPLHLFYKEMSAEIKKLRKKSKIARMFFRVFLAAFGLLAVSGLILSLYFIG